MGHEIQKQQIFVEAISDQAFQPFGIVLRHPGNRQRHYVDEVIGGDPSLTSRFWINNPANILELPFTINRMERHKKSAQTFLPLNNTRYLAIVCQTNCDDEPDLATLRAFEVKSPDGITFNQGVWHCGLTLLGAHTNFAVIMALSGENDDEFFNFSSLVTICDVQDGGSHASST